MAALRVSTVVKTVTMAMLFAASVLHNTSAPCFKL